MAKRRIAWWKLLGLAGAAGVAASGVLVARNQRQRTSYTPEQVRARLQERLNEVAKDE
jgi:glutamate dehydrogenase/leucine dehydrogenase